MPEVTIRGAEANDHARVVAVVDDWWGGRAMAAMLPRLFFEHFADTSFVAEYDGELVGFLCGFLSQSQARAAYVHFVGVAPTMRGTGLARTLYACFFEVARSHGRDVVLAVTSPMNTTSVAFHRAMGFEVREPVSGYDGPGEDRVRLTKRLT
jgi:predicted GNAT superfamily acetyltransferase